MAVESRWGARGVFNEGGAAVHHCSRDPISAGNDPAPAEGPELPGHIRHRELPGHSGRNLSATIVAASGSRSLRGMHPIGRSTSSPLVPALLALCLSACGSRSSLEAGAGESATAGSAGSGGGATATGGGGSAGGTSTAGGAGGAPVNCTFEDLLSWSPESFHDEGNYERAVAATSGVPWIAFKVDGGNIVLRKLGIDEEKGIVVEQEFEIPGTPVYPVAFDVSDARFVVLTTTGINWNGDVGLLSIDRATGEVKSSPVGDPPENPAYTVGSAIGILGDDVAIAYSRLVNDQGTLEIRDADLAVVTSATVEGSYFTAVRRDPLSLDLYTSSGVLVNVEPGAVTFGESDPSWSVIGGLHDSLAALGAEVRLTRGDSTWTGPWPHTQVSPPAVVRELGDRSVFSLETELTGVVGYPVGTELRWMPIEPTPEDSGIGLVLMPLFTDRRVGMFYLGLDIPDPQQRLRYFGRVCQ